MGPRTADELITAYNRAATGDVVDYGAVLEMLYAENAIQRQILAILRDALPVTELDAAVEATFGHTHDNESAFRLKPDSKPARITSRDGDRANGITTDDQGREDRLYLVRIEDRWWRTPQSRPRGGRRAPPSPIFRQEPAASTAQGALSTPRRAGGVTFTLANVFILRLVNAFSALRAPPRVLALAS